MIEEDVMTVTTREEEPALAPPPGRGAEWQDKAEVARAARAAAAASRRGRPVSFRAAVGPRHR